MLSGREDVATVNGRTPIRTVSIMDLLGGANDAIAQQYGLYSATGDFGPAYPMRLKTAQIVNPAPSAAIVFVDESQNTVDDGVFGLTWTMWKNSPGARHSRGTTFSFADGHVEKWRWLGITAEMNYNVTPSGAAQQADF
jgi:prepilin-type processing-associated H-X9-DG protein